MFYTQCRLLHTSYVSNLDFKRPTARTTYHKLSEEIERSSKFLYTAIIPITTSAITMPNIIAAYAKFYVLGLNERESFELPSPMMSVQMNS